MHPLARYLVPVGVILIVLGFLWALLGPIIHYLLPFWPLLAIAVGVGLLFWRLPLAQVRTILSSIGQAASTQPLRGLLIGILFTVIYGGLIWLGYGYGAGELTRRFGFEPRWTWVLVTALGLPMIPAFWYLYQATEIPGDPKNIRRGVSTIMLFVLVFFAWWYHSQPNQLFDHLTGTSKFWVAEEEKAIYHSPGFSPVTGEELRQGTPEDVARFKKKAWTDRLAEKLEKSRREPSVAPRAESVIREDGIMKPGAGVTLRAGERRAFLVEGRKGIRLEPAPGNLVARARIISPSDQPTFEFAGKIVRELEVEVDRTAGRGTPWIVSRAEIMGVVVVAETPIRVVARSTEMTIPKSSQPPVSFKPHST